MIVKAKKQLLNLPEGILLGLSGGPDSMCLCALLVECGIKFHIAHVDHGLSSDSYKEMERLKIFAKENSIPFHLCSLNAANLKGNNLEEILRDKRLQFFSTIIKNNSLKTLLLGHQKDEKAETMIKRFFEGGSLFNLSGIKKYSTYQDMEIVRPLLDVSKESVINYLLEKNIPFYTDPTNFTGDNLRAKMRRSLIPKLELEFGKNIVSSICDLGDQVEDARIYLEKQVASVKYTAIKGKYGVFYPYSKEVDDYLFSLLIFSVLKEENLFASRDQRLFIKEGITGKVSGKSLTFENFHLYFDSVGLFLISNAAHTPIPGILERDIHWLDFWKEGVDHPSAKKITEEEYNTLIDRKKVSEYHRIHKTPICLRPLFPIPLTTIRKKIKIEA